MTGLDRTQSQAKRRQVAEVNERWRTNQESNTRAPHFAPQQRPDLFTEPRFKLPGERERVRPRSNPARCGAGGNGLRLLHPDRRCRPRAENDTPSPTSFTLPCISASQFDDVK